MNVSTRFWHATADGRMQCDVCPRRCRLAPGQHGFCLVRAAEDDGIVLTAWGRSSGFQVDPIEKKPLNHFLPGTSVLSFGTAGCNLACRGCQNWAMSQARSLAALSAEALPDEIARSAVALGCRSVAFTFNDPVTWLEWAADVADACHDAGLRTVAVTAGYVLPEARAELFRHVDAANVDLKAFSDRFYREQAGARLAPVLDTLRWLVHEGHAWLELTLLLIPGLNDGDAEIGALTRWVASELGPDVPLHVTAFHPDGRLRDRPATPPSSLARARAIGLCNGLHHVYTGNVRDLEGGTTRCHACEAVLVVRDGCTIRHWAMAEGGRCPRCGSACAGVFERAPGRWGARSLPVALQH